MVHSKTMSSVVRRVARRKNAPLANDVRYYNTESYGLCNQLFSVACALADGIHFKAPVAFIGFYPDMTSSRHVAIDQLLNIDKTNKNLAERGTSIVMKSSNRYERAIMFPQTQWQKEYHAACLRFLVFSDPIRALANSLAPKQPFYCIHFRLDIDMVLFYRAGPHVYQHWIRLTDQGREAEARRLASEQVGAHKEWIHEQVTRYVDAAKRYCADATLPVIALTAIGKPTLLLGQNDLVEWAFQEFSVAVAPRQVLRNTDFSSLGREYSAAVELCIACNENCAGFVASGGSTFSETIKQRIEPAKRLHTV